jgi:hypothetical protein
MSDGEFKKRLATEEEITVANDIIEDVELWLEEVKEEFPMDGESKSKFEWFIKWFGGE